MFKYKTKGTCSREIALDIDKDGIITDLKFEGGCRGNLQGISKLVIGKNAQEVMNTLQGIKCQGSTSCPDQLAKAIKSYYELKQQ